MKMMMMQDTHGWILRLRSSLKYRRLCLTPFGCPPSFSSPSEYASTIFFFLKQKLFERILITDRTAARRLSDKRKQTQSYKKNMEPVIKTLRVAAGKFYFDFVPISCLNSTSAYRLIMWLMQSFKIITAQTVLQHRHHLMRIVYSSFETHPFRLAHSRIFRTGIQAVAWTASVVICKTEWLGTPAVTHRGEVVIPIQC